MDGHGATPYYFHLYSIFCLWVMNDCGFLRTQYAQWKTAYVLM